MTQDKLTLEIPCPICHGTGKMQGRECLTCAGKGTVLTEEGKKILDFLRDSIRLSEH